MRNYLPAFFSHVSFTDGFNNFEDFWLAGSETRALDLAQSDANNLQGSGYTILDVSILGKRWFELNKHNFDQLLEHVSAQQYWNNGEDIALVVKKNPRPAGFNSKTEKKGAQQKSGKVGKLIVSDLTYLELVLSQWILGETSQGRRLGGVLVPQRWIDQLTKIIADLKAGKITGEVAIAKLAKIS